MENYIIGKKYLIHSYKHNGTIHRAWDEATLIEENEDYLVFGNDKTLVQESDGRTWRTKEPAILFFYKDKWYNVIGQFKEDGIYYYCNMASPFLIEDDTIKYIDYDLDLRVFSDGTYKVLDKGEYKYHKEKMNYSKDIDLILNKELKNLIEKVKSKKGPFDKEKIQVLKEKYEKLKKTKKNVDNYNMV